VSASYQQAYLDAAKEAPFLPKDRAELQVLLDAYLPEKVIYELGYELNDSPAWVSPLSGPTRSDGPTREVALVA
jgi:maltose alpha-D-glucosyltransferase / alpha-amylase